MKFLKMLKMFLHLLWVKYVIYNVPRQIPYILQEYIDKELDDFENKEIIQKMNYSEWGRPLIIVSSFNGKEIRLCVDNKFTVNQQLQGNRHPMQTIEDIFNKRRTANFLYLGYL